MSAHNSNLFLRLYSKMVIDANNPLANLTTIPADNAFLPTLIDCNVHRNTFTQATPANQFQFKQNYVNGNHAIYMSGVTTQMTCPYDATKNGYSGAITVTFLCRPDTVGITAHFFGQLPIGGGFSVGQSNDDAFFVTLGASVYTQPNQFDANQWDVLTMRYDGATTVSFFKDGAFVGNISGSAITPSSGNFILGGYSTSTPNLNFIGHVNLVGYDNRAHTDAEILAAHAYALSRVS